MLRKVRNLFHALNPVHLRQSIECFHHHRKNGKRDKQTNDEAIIICVRSECAHFQCTLNARVSVMGLSQLHKFKYDNHFIGHDAKAIMRLVCFAR